MFEIKAIDHIVLKTNNTKKMLHFYCGILGAQVEKEQPKLNLTQLRIGENLIDIVEVSSKINQQESNLEHFCLRIAPFNYDTLAEYFKKHSIEVKRYGERYGSQGMGYSFYIDDPEGNEVELCEYKTQ